MKNHKVVYNGREMTDYEASQLQRRMERSIRSSKQELVMYDEAKKNVFTDEEKALWQQEFNNTSVKLKSQEARLKDFCNQTGRYLDTNRTQAFAVATENGIKNYGRSVSKKAFWANKFELTKIKEEDIIKEIKSCGIKGEVHLVPKQYNLKNIKFDDKHINKERQHNVSKREAISYIKNAEISVSTWKGKFENYIGFVGASYINTETNTIRTAYNFDEFDDTVKKVLEVLKKYGR